MLKPFCKLSSQKLASYVQDLFFFIFFFLYLWLRVDTRLIYHTGGAITNFPVFFRGSEFFRQFTSYPGGLTEYAAAFLSQSFYIGWAGALVATLQAILICLCLDYFLKAIGANPIRWLRFVPSILLLIAYTRYAYYFVTATAFLVSLIFLCLYLKIAPANNLHRYVVFLIFSVAVYTAAAGAYLLFAVLCALYELFFTRRWKLAPLYLLSAAAVTYITGVLVFGVSLADAFGHLLPCSWQVMLYPERRRLIIIPNITYLLLPATALAFGLWRIFLKKNIREKLRSAILPSFTGTPGLRWLAESCLLLAASAAAVVFSCDTEQKTLLEVDYYACQKNWPKVLEAASHYRNSFYVVNHVNRALYHTGRLGSEMFAFPQNPNTLFLTGGRADRLSQWKRLDTCIEFGFLNQAEGDLAELLEVFSEHPLILKRLALVNLAKENIGAARIYLCALRKTFFHDDWADYYLALIQSDPELSTDRTIRDLRRLMPKNDEADISSTLFENSSHDRMAFEYSMALCLLTKRLDIFVRNLGRLDDFGYSQIPHHYEEAILLSGALTKKKIDLHGRKISQQTIQSFEKFFQTLESYGQDKQAAFKELVKDYGDSFFLYYFYNRSGMTK